MGGIVWIASYPKSGNTWLRLFVANLIADRDEPLDINAVGRFVPGEADPGWFRAAVRRPLRELSEAEIAALRPEVHRRIARAKPKGILLKTHNVLGEDRGHPLIAMEATAGAIYVVRDPRDVALSARSHFGLDLDETIAAMARSTRSSPEPEQQIYEVYESWSNHVRSWTQDAHPRLLVLRYEDLHARPLEAFGAVARALGLGRDRRRIERAIAHSSFAEASAQEKTKGFGERSRHAERFFHSGRAGAWRDLLTPAQAERTARDHGEQMRRFGYL
jgi:DNA-binding Lrp family transcriptional regulator